MFWNKENIKKSYVYSRCVECGLTYLNLLRWNKINWINTIWTNKMSNSFAKRFFILDSQPSNHSKSKHPTINHRLDWFEFPDNSIASTNFLTDNISHAILYQCKITEKHSKNSMLKLLLVFASDNRNTGSRCIFSQRHARMHIPMCYNALQYNIYKHWLLIEI